MSHTEHESRAFVAPVAGSAQYDLVEVAEAMRSLSQWVAEDHAGGRAQELPVRDGTSELGPSVAALGQTGQGRGGRQQCALPAPAPAEPERGGRRADIYSDAPDASDRSAVGFALILATHGRMVVSEHLASHRVENLSKALVSNREIGVAMGVLMHQYQFTRQEAFDVLRVASQNSNRKLADIAVEVADTGGLTIERHG